MVIQTDKPSTPYSGGTIDRVVGNVSPEQVNYIPLEQIPKLERAFRITRLRLSMLRRSVGLEDRTINHSEVRLVPARDYDKHLGPLAGGKLTEGICHRPTGISFIRVGEGALDSNYKLVHLSWVIAHEMFHSAIGYNFSGYPEWNEGLPDFLARDAVRCATPFILEPEERHCNEVMIEVFTKKPSDSFANARHAIVYMPDGLGPVYTCRFREIDIIERMHEKYPRNYETLLRRALGAKSLPRGSEPETEPLPYEAKAA
jgi:hypothetical protein